MKDFFDLYALATGHQFDRTRLHRSIKATFERRNTELPTDLPTMLGEGLLQDSTKQTQWTAFIRRIDRDPAELHLALVLEKIRGFLRIVWDQAFAGSVSTWTPQDGWH